MRKRFRWNRITLAAMLIVLLILVFVFCADRKKFAGLENSLSPRQETVQTEENEGSLK